MCCKRCSTIVRWSLDGRCLSRRNRRLQCDRLPVLHTARRQRPTAARTSTIRTMTSALMTRLRLAAVAPVMRFLRQVTIHDLTVQAPATRPRVALTLAALHFMASRFEHDVHLTAAFTYCLSSLLSNLWTNLTLQQAPK